MCDFSAGGARLPQPSTHLCEGAPPCGLCLHCSAPPLPLHHHHHTHTPPQVLQCLYVCVCVHKQTSRCYLLIVLSPHLCILLPYSSIYISRKSWHTLLNTCFHIAMTSAIYAGGISLTSYPVVCQAISPDSTQSPHFDLSRASSVSYLTVTCDRLASSCTTPRCPPCCGSESAPGSSTKRLCGECHGSRTESLLLHLLSDLCSGQRASLTLTFFLCFEIGVRDQYDLCFQTDARVLVHGHPDCGPSKWVIVFMNQSPSVRKETLHYRVPL